MDSLSFELPVAKSDVDFDRFDVKSEIDEHSQPICCVVIKDGRFYFLFQKDLPHPRLLLAVSRY